MSNRIDRNDKTENGRALNRKYTYKWIDGHPQRNWTIRTINRHKEKYSVEFDIDWLTAKALETITCEFCGKTLFWGRGRGTLKKDSPTLERLDNELILTKTNIAIICHECNRTKGDRTFNDFINYCGKIYEIHKSNKNLDVVI